LAKILVVDDFEDSRFSLCRLLEISGYEVVEAADGQEAIDRAAGEKPDLVLMDLSLPVVSGIDATRRIRELQGDTRMPIIAVSAHDTDRFHEDAIAAGCDDYITKPIDFDELEALIARYLADPHPSGD
jgi:two-component system, cell cycle response regulator DivK